jgi:hypothetical protein
MSLARINLFVPEIQRRVEIACNVDFFFACLLAVQKPNRNVKIVSGCIPFLLEMFCVTGGVADRLHSVTVPAARHC